MIEARRARFTNLRGRLGVRAGLSIGLLWAAGVGQSLAATPCGITERTLPTRPMHYRGIVQGPASEADIKSQTQIAITRSGAPISPKYVNLPRIDAIYVADGAKHSTIAAVVNGRIPAKGEKVELASRYRDPDQPCSFIPWTVVDTVASKN